MKTLQYAANMFLAAAVAAGIGLFAYLVGMEFALKMAQAVVK